MLQYLSQFIISMGSLVLAVGLLSLVIRKTLKKESNEKTTVCIGGGLLAIVCGIVMLIA